MAYSRERIKKDGTRFYEIRGYSKEKKAYFSKYYYPPFGWSQRAIDKALRTECESFQKDIDDGKILTKEEAKKKEEAEKAEREKLKTVKQYGEGVFMPTKLLSISENTRISYETNLSKHIYPIIGDTLLVEVTSAMISKLLLDFRKNHSYGSAVKVYNVLNGLFEMALFDDSIPVSPMNKVKRPKQKKDEKAITEADKAFTAQELNYVLSCVANEPIKWQAFLYLAADTGCRRGELVGIQWNDIDLKNGIVAIKHNMQYSKAKGVYDVTPKGGKFRTVDLGEDTIAILTAYKEQLQKPAEADETENDNNDHVVSFDEYKKKQAKKKPLPKWVFTVDGENKPMFPTSPTEYFKDFGEKYGVPGFHPHLLRHTSASLSLTNGGDVKSIADRLGHKDASVTLRMYAHANDESIRAAGQAARDALKKQKEEQKQKKKEKAGA